MALINERQNIEIFHNKIQVRIQIMQTHCTKSTCIIGITQLNLLSERKYIFEIFQLSKLITKFQHEDNLNRINCFLILVYFCFEIEFQGLDNNNLDLI